MLPEQGVVGAVMASNGNVENLVRMTRAPLLRLRPFVRCVWLSGRRSTGGVSEARENVLPTGEMHVVFRLSDDALRLIVPGPVSSEFVAGHAIVGGPRAAYYTKCTARAALSVGAQLRAGAAEVLFGAPATEFTGRHVALEDLWGRQAELVRARLIEAGDPARQLDVLETVLLERSPAITALHPAVAGALAYFATAASVREAVRRSGYSHRAFVALFRKTVGLTPKTYTRVLRFQRVLAELSATTNTGCAPSWVDLAMRAGYSDQSHFVREFREFAGVTPEYYRRAAPAASHHVASPGL
jgi:AraC-like DNA-binding protein